MRIHSNVCIVIIFLSTNCLVQATVQRFLGCTADSTSINECAYQAYTGRAIGYSIAGFLLAALTVAVCPFYYAFRYCCNCCGGRTASMSCCGCKSPAALYSRWDLVRPRLYAAIFLGLGLGSCAWGIIATAKILLGLKSLADLIDAVPSVLATQLDTIQNDLILTSYTPLTNITTQYNPFNGSVAQALGEEVLYEITLALQNNVGKVTMYTEYGNVSLNILFSIYMLLVILGAVCAVLSVRRYVPMVTVMLMFVIGSLVWAAHGIANPFALLASDFCAEVHSLSIGDQTVLMPVFGCNETMLSNFSAAFLLIEGEVAGAACMQLLAMCYNNSQAVYQNIQQGTVYNCSSTLSCSEINFGTLVEIFTNVYTDSSIVNYPNASTEGYTCNLHTNSCTPLFCADECVMAESGALSTIGRLSKQAGFSFAATQQVATTRDTLGGQYSSCFALMQLSLSPFDADCQELLADGALSLRVATGLAGAVSFIFIFTMIWGSKRFREFNTDNERPEYEMDRRSVSPPAVTLSVFPGKRITR